MAITCARVVLPLPGGPQRISDGERHVVGADCGKGMDDVCPLAGGSIPEVPYIQLDGAIPVLAAGAELDYFIGKDGGGGSVDATFGGDVPDHHILPDDVARRAGPVRDEVAGSAVLLRRSLAAPSQCSVVLSAFSAPAAKCAKSSG